MNWNRPLAVYPAGEGDSVARMYFAWDKTPVGSSGRWIRFCRGERRKRRQRNFFLQTGESRSPATRGGRGRRQTWCEALHVGTGHPRM